jgi:hypothetical protein
VKQGFGFVDNRPEIIVQGKLQKLAYNDNKGSVQLKIKTKTNLFQNENKLPPEGATNQKVKDLANSQETSLIQTNEHLKERCNGINKPLLTAHRHIIGESHDNSHYPRFVKEWGWGAEKMSESLQTSDTVKNDSTESNISWNNKSNYYYQNKPLENMHAYTITDLSVYRLRLEIVRANYSKVAGNKRNKSSYDKEKGSINTNLDALKETNKNFIPLWTDYKKACLAIATKQNKTNSETKLMVINNKLTTTYNDLDGRLKNIVKRPWNAIFTSPATKYDKLAKTTEELRNNLFELLTDISEIMKSEANNQSVNQVSGQMILDVQDTYGYAGNSLTATQAIREVFMKKNISNLGIPSLIATGSEHAKSQGLANIQSAKYHNSFNDLDADLINPL